MKRYIPIKNYFIAGFIILVIIGLSIYGYKWYKVYQIEQTRESYLLKTNTISMQITDIDNIKTILMEAPSDYYVYIGYTRSVDILNLEKKLKKIIDNYGINDNIYYIDATKNRDEILNKINSNLDINIKAFPAVIYVADSNIDKNDIIESNKKPFEADKFEKLIKNNGVEKISQ